MTVHRADLHVRPEIIKATRKLVNQNAPVLEDRFVALAIRAVEETLRRSGRPPKVEKETGAATDEGVITPDVTFSLDIGSLTGVTSHDLTPLHLTALSGELRQVGNTRPSCGRATQCGRLEIHPQLCLECRDCERSFRSQSHKRESSAPEGHVFHCVPRLLLSVVACSPQLNGEHRMKRRTRDDQEIHMRIPQPGVRSVLLTGVARGHVKQVA